MIYAYTATVFALTVGFIAFIGWRIWKKSEIITVTGDTLDLNLKPLEPVATPTASRSTNPASTAAIMMFASENDSITPPATPDRPQASPPPPPVSGGSSNGTPPPSGTPPSDPPPEPDSNDDGYTGWRKSLRNSGIRYLYAVYATILLVAFFVSLYFSSLTHPLWVLPIVASGCFIYYMYEPVTPAEYVILSLGGMIVLPPDRKRYLQPGPYFNPPLVEMIRFPKREILMMFGTAQAGSDAENELDRLMTEHPGIPIYVDRSPVRTSWNMSEGERQGKSLADVLTTDPPLYVILQISDPENYYKLVGMTTEEGLRRIRVVMVGALQEIAGRTSISHAMSHIADINRQLQEAVEKLVGDSNTTVSIDGRRKSWGVDIKTAAMMSPGFSHDVNKAFAVRKAAVVEAEGRADATVLQSVADATATGNAADAEAKARERKALAKKKELIEEGLGQKAQLASVGEGAAAALAARAKVAGTKGGRVIIQTDALRDAVRDGNVTILPAELSGLTTILSGVAAGSEMLAGKKKKTGGSEDPPKKTE